MTEIDKLLEDRGSRYGDFATQAEVSQAIRKALHDTPNWDTLPPYMREGLDMCVSKLSRILVGDPMYMDNVIDLIGYLTLVKTEMEKEHARIKKYADRVLATQEKTDRLSDPEVRSYYAHLFDDAKDRGPLRWPGPYDYT